MFRPLSFLLCVPTKWRMKGSYLSDLPGFLTLHSFSVTFFYPRLSPFLIQLQINTHIQVTGAVDAMHLILALDLSIHNKQQFSNECQDRERSEDGQRSRASLIAFSRNCQSASPPGLQSPRCFNVTYPCKVHKLPSHQRRSKRDVMFVQLCSLNNSVSLSNVRVFFF